MSKETKNNKMWTAYGLALHLGYMIVIPILLFGVGGVLLDKYSNTFPLFTFIGFVLSMIVAMLTVYTKMKDIVIAGKISKTDKKVVPND